MLIQQSQAGKSDHARAQRWLWRPTSQRARSASRDEEFIAYFMGFTWDLHGIYHSYTAIPSRKLRYIEWEFIGHEMTFFLVISMGIHGGCHSFSLWWFDIAMRKPWTTESSMIYHDVPMKMVMVHGSVGLLEGKHEIVEYYTGGCRKKVHPQF